MPPGIGYGPKPDFRQLSRGFPNAGEFFNATERARAGQNVPGLSDLSEEDLVAANRYAQSLDSPATSLASIPYELLKYMEQETPIDPLSGIASAYEGLQGPNALSAAIRPDERTSPASLSNVGASLSGGRDALLQGIQRLLGRR